MSFKNPSERTLHLTVPARKINDNVSLTDQQCQLLDEYSTPFINPISSNSKTFTSTGIKIPQQENWKEIEESIINGDHRFHADFLHCAFIYVITESVGDYPYPYFTEKTWKAIVAGRPFMLVGAKGSLSKLQEFGFKTFSHWWDEGYDQLPKVVDRIESIVKTLSTFSSLSNTELQDLNTEIMPILKHNQQHLKVFTQQNLDNIARSI
jgi:hypothetical protein